MAKTAFIAGTAGSAAGLGKELAKAARRAGIPRAAFRKHGTGPRAALALAAASLAAGFIAGRVLRKSDRRRIEDEAVDAYLAENIWDEIDDDDEGVPFV